MTSSHRLVAKGHFYLLLAGLCMAMVMVACGSSSNSGNQAATPTAPYAGATAFPGQQLNPYQALGPSYGSWQSIGSEQYFVPSPVYLNSIPNWQPYQNGAWGYDQDLGWSFSSQDPWGWMTEHYGIWRHHNQFGWIWLPFRDLHYEASCVTWFDQGNYVGWYPYGQRFSAYYESGHGFDDGYWNGYQSVLSMGISGNGFFLGITLVDRADVTRSNVFSHVIRDPVLIARVAVSAHSPERIAQGFVGPHPGGSLEASYQYIQGRAQAQAPVGHAQTITSKGGAQITQPFAAGNNHRGTPAKTNPAVGPAKQNPPVVKQEPVRQDPPKQDPPKQVSPTRPTEPRQTQQPEPQQQPKAAQPPESHVPKRTQQPEPQVTQRPATQPSTPVESQPMFKRAAPQTQPPAPTFTRPATQHQPAETEPSAPQKERSQNSSTRS